MRGDKIIVRAYRDELLIRRIWDETNEIIYITDDEQFSLLSQGKEAIQPMAFFRKDVFKYIEPIALDKLESY